MIDDNGLPAEPPKLMELLNVFKSTLEGAVMDLEEDLPKLTEPAETQLLTTYIKTVRDIISEIGGIEFFEYSREHYQAQMQALRKHIDVFKGLSVFEIMFIAQEMEEITLRTELNYIMKKGEPVDGVYFLNKVTKDGKVIDTIEITEDGKKTSLGKDRLIGHYAFSDKEYLASNSTVKIINDVKAFKIESNKFQELLRRFPQILTNIHEKLNKIKTKNLGKK
ncbi:MAG: cyclic nucleotide-binding domain-containing protein [SAR324 cluster bacterium]|nr:cyclic nucleotide-binding domain-containing protein [SAR324 cluster bacterium]